MPSQIVNITKDTVISVNGKLFTITPSFSSGTLQLNGVELVNGEPVQITQDSTLTVTPQEAPVIQFNFPDSIKVLYNEVELTNGQKVSVTDNGSIQILNQLPTFIPVTFNLEGVSTAKYETESGTSGNIIDGETINIPVTDKTNVQITGATAIPKIIVNGEGISSFSVNGKQFEISQLPYTFTPMSGFTNTIFMTGQNTEDKTLTISGTNIASMTVNNIPVTLPYTTVVNEPLDISVSGEVYQVDVSSAGGALIFKDGVQISDGKSLHTILDINKDTFLSIDGTHTLTVSGNDIKTITVNEVSVDVDKLPVTVTNNSMTASIMIGGYPPSEIHISGTYIDTATLDGNAVKIGANGSVDLEVEVREENHFLSIVGSQPREYGLTFNDHGVTDILMDGVKQQSGTTAYINDAQYIESEAKPIPLIFDMDEMTIVEINGKPYYGDFTVNVSRETQIDVNSSSCKVTIDYGDNSFTLSVPQQLITLCAPHRDGWIFDTWTSNDVGIINPREVRCNIDLTNIARAHLVANYQRYITRNKPNHWN